MNTDTPETDAHLLGGSYSFDASFARNLEHQRNKAIDECIALRQMARELRDALEDLYGWARNWDSPFMDDEQFDKSKYLDKITKANQLLP